MQSTSFKTREDQNKLNIILLMVYKISVWNSILVVLCNISNYRKQFLMELLFLTESESLCFGTLCDPMDYTVHGILQAKIQKWVAFPFSRGSSQPRTPSLQVNSLLAEPQGSPKILEWVAYPFSRGSSWPRNRTRVSCIAGGLFTNWAMREALFNWIGI